MYHLADSLTTAGRTQGNAQLEALGSFKICQADISALKEIAPTIEAHLPMIANAYIEHLERSAYRGKFNSLQGPIMENMRHMIRGNFESHDVLDGWTLGQAFVEIGVPLAALSGAASVCCERAYPLIFVHCQHNPSQLIHALMAFQKAVLWDQEMITSSYNKNLYLAPTNDVSLSLKQLIGRLAEGSKKFEAGLAV